VEWMRCLYECEIHTRGKTIQDWSNANLKMNRVREDNVKSVLKQREKEKNYSRCLEFHKFSLDGARVESKLTRNCS
jgi:hypothetical protein